MTITQKHVISGNLEYSLDGTTWTAISPGITTSAGTQIFFRGKMSENRLFTGCAPDNGWVFDTIMVQT